MNELLESELKELILISKSSTIVPRSIVNDPKYLSARMKYRHVFFVILVNSDFSPISVMDKNMKIFGIWKFSKEEGIRDLCNEAGFKGDKLGENIVSKAISYFEKCGFLSCEVNQGKTEITIKAILSEKDGTDEI